MMRASIRILGASLAAVGALAILWAIVTWQWGDPATSAYTRWKQRSLSAEFERLVTEYGARRAGPGKKTRDIERIARRMREDREIGAAIGRIRIERLGLDMVIVYGTDSASLRKGPGLDPRTFLPGERELAYIAGHRTTFGAPFAHIDRLRPGDRVVIEMPYGRFSYRVERSIIVPADDVARLHSRGTEELALQACHPRFSARERYLVYAIPVSTARA